MSPTRSDVLKALRSFPIPVAAKELAQLIGAPRYAVNRPLTGLYARDLIDREPDPRAPHRFIYRAKELQS